MGCRRHLGAGGGPEPCDREQDAPAALEVDLADELAGVADDRDAEALAIEPFEVPLETSGIRITQMSLIWIPVI